MKQPHISNLVTSGFHKPTRMVRRHDQYTTGETTGGLSVPFTILCIVDLFGVFPIIALPKSIIDCGVYGIPLVLGVFSLQLYTAVLLGRCWILAKQITPLIMEKNRFPYAAVAELAYGRRARSLVTFLIDATVFSAGVPNLIVASQSMQLFWWKITGGEVGISYCHWMLLIGLLLCPVMWLGSPKDMKPIALISVLTVSIVAVSTWCCILTDDISLPSTNGLINYVPSVKELLTAYGIMAFQFDIHPMLLTVQVDMKDSRKINVAVVGGFAVTAFMFSVTSFIAAERYGKDIHSNILEGIPPSIPLFIVALLVTLQLCLSSAVGNSALFQHIEDLLQVPRDFCFQRCLIRSGIVALAVFLGESVPRFDLVMGLVGSTLTGPLMFVLPPLFFLKLCYMKTQEKYKNCLRHIDDINQNGVDGEIQNGNVSLPLIYKKAIGNTYNTFGDIRMMSSDESIANYNIQWYDVVFALVVVLLGLATTVVATFLSWNQTITSAQFTKPCLWNATEAARSYIFGIKTML